MGTRIRIARERAGLTQEQLASIIDKSTQYISDLERGVTGAKVSTIVDICVALNTSADYLLFGEEKELKQSSLTLKIQNLSPKDKDIAANVLAYLIHILKSDND